MSIMAIPGGWQHVDVLLLLMLAWLAIGALGLTAVRNFVFVARVLFPLGALVALAVAIISLAGIGQGAQTTVLSLGLPTLPFHFRLDDLAGFFVAIIALTAVGVSVFAAGYFRQGEGTPPGLLCLEYHLFLVSMVLVVLADDAYAFMVCWETMALSSFFLVTANHRIPEIRSAGYLYLLIAHVGAIGILLCFGVLQANTGDYTFANMRAQELSPFWSSLAMLLALAGFGAKAGLVPLHVWLPEAHPAAPSPVSALMSAVMLKTAVYGFLRVSLDLLHTPIGWWGVLLLGIGLLTAMFGVIFAAVQTDMKRLLAYSSIENIGLLFAGIGLTLLFAAYDMKPMAALTLTAVLYHVASHAMFKSLLFLATGAVLHATAERSLGKLGGLIRFMPWVAWLSLLAVLASAGLPPLGGFVSEWLLLQGFLFAPALPSSLLQMLIPGMAAVIALVSALSGYTMVKFYGVVFLGQPRERKLHQAHEAGWWERAGMLWLGLGCVVLGLLPARMIGLIDPITRQLVDGGIGDTVATHGWLLVPVAIERASYGPVVFLLGVLASFALAFVLVRTLYHGRVRRAPPWDCGYPLQDARMQDSAEGFGQPIRHIFGPAFRITRVLPSPFDRQPKYAVTVADHFWHWLYLPVAAATERVARLVGRMQQGRISIYLLYSFITLIATLLLVHR